MQIYEGIEQMQPISNMISTILKWFNDVGTTTNVVLHPTWCNARVKLAPMHTQKPIAVKCKWNKQKYAWKYLLFNLM